MVRYKVIFEPQKTVSAKVEMVVEKSTGGRWRFELRLEATQPDVDGSITIQAAPGQSALGPVQLYSPTDQPEPFTCHFTHDSSISFDVSPSEVRPDCDLYVQFASPYCMHIAYLDTRILWPWWNLKVMIARQCTSYGR